MNKLQNQSNCILNSSYNYVQLPKKKVNTLTKKKGKIIWYSIIIEKSRILFVFPSHMSHLTIH